MTEERNFGDERAAIVGAAWTVLERSGFEGFKVQLVLRETGLSARTFYRHFVDKDALVLALIQDEYARSGRRLRRAVDQATDPVDQVEAWIAELVHAADHPRRAARARLFTAQQAVMRRFPDEVATATRLVVEPLEDSDPAGGRDMGVFPWADVGRDAELIIRVAGSSMNDALAERPDRSVDDVVADATGFALRALGVPPAS